MSRATVGLLVLVAWAGVGLVVSLVMGRRGHAPFSWAVLGVVFGPLAIPLAVSSARRERAATARRVGSGVAGPGSVDVLVGVDGSPEASAALGTVAGLVGERLGRLTIAAVLDFDTAESDMQWGERDRALAELARDADELEATTGRRPETQLLAGRPAEVLGRFAADEGFELLAVGSRGRGLSKVMLGSVAAKLAGGSAVPVLIVAAPAEPAHPAAEDPLGGGASAV
jgi:nucleotide-binding universal stress UspA family protein